VILGGNLAASGDMSLPLVMVAAAAGAIVGDNICFALGTLVGERTVKRWFGGQKSQARLLWAERMLDERGAYIIIIGRFIPGGRTAVTFSAGYIPTFPWRRFIVYDIHTFLGLLIALGIALSVGLAIEVVRHLRQRRTA
jgi:membrane-associated protein